MTGPNGYRYEGDWVNGVKQGNAEIAYPDGSVYEGRVANGLRDGQGKLTCPTG